MSKSFKKLNRPSTFVLCLSITKEILRPRREIMSESEARLYRSLANYHHLTGVARRESSKEMTTFTLVELNQCDLKMRPQNLQQNIWMWIERLCTGVTLTLLPVGGAFLSGKLMDLRAVSKGTILIYLSLSRILSQCKPIKSKCWTGFINEVINEYVLIRGWAGTMDNSHDNKLTDCCFMTLQSDLKIHRVTPLWWGIRTLIS